MVGNEGTTRFFGCVFSQPADLESSGLTWLLFAQQPSGDPSSSHLHTPNNSSVITSSVDWAAWKPLSDSPMASVTHIASLFLVTFRGLFVPDNHLTLCFSDILVIHCLISSASSLPVSSLPFIIIKLTNKKARQQVGCLTLYSLCL